MESEASRNQHIEPMKRIRNLAGTVFNHINQQPAPHMSSHYRKAVVSDQLRIEFPVIERTDISQLQNTARPYVSDYYDDLTSYAEIADSLLPPSNT